MRGVRVEMCPEPGCVLWAEHPMGQHCYERVWMFQCPHGIPDFGTPCDVCDLT